MRGEALRLRTVLLSSYLLDFIQYIYPHILTLGLSIHYGILGGPTAACSIWMSLLGDISTYLSTLMPIILFRYATCSRRYGCTGTKRA